MNTPKIRFKLGNCSSFLDWKAKNIGDFAKVVGGRGFPLELQNEKTKEIPFHKVSSMNLKENELYLRHSTNYISVLTAKREKYHPFDTDGIVFAKVGAAVLLDRKRIAIAPYLIDNNMMSINMTNSEEIDFLFFYYWLNQFKLSSLCQVGALPSITSGQINKLKINYPCLEEQQKIASFFSTLDEKIELSERKLEALEQLKKGLMQKIFSQEIRFHQDNGGSFPIWNNTKLGIFFNKISSGKSKKVDSGSHLLYGATGVIGKTNDCLYKGDKILVARVGSVGTVNFVTEPIGISDNTLVLSSPQFGLDLKWLYYFFEYFDLSKLSAGSSQKLITSTQLKNFYVNLPSIFEQKKIAALFTLLDRKIELMKHQKNLYNTLKLGFMQQMFV